MTVHEYLSVPVAVARDVGQRYHKDVVVIIAWDRAHARTHSTTWGATVNDKPAAARLGDILAKAAGAELPADRVDEDYRRQTQAEWAVERDRLVAFAGELLKLQRHYGQLLNAHDGGERRPVQVPREIRHLFPPEGGQ